MSKIIKLTIEEGKNFVDSIAQTDFTNNCLIRYITPEFDVTLFSVRMMKTDPRIGTKAFVTLREKREIYLKQELIRITSN